MKVVLLVFFVRFCVCLSAHKIAYSFEWILMKFFTNGHV